MPAATHSVGAPAEAPPYPKYYPRIDLDSLFYIVDDNAAHRVLIGSSAAGRHLLDLIFSDELRELQAGDWKAMVIRAVAGFHLLTDRIKNTDLYCGIYNSTVENLRRLRDFSEIEDAARSPEYSPSMESQGVFVACNLYFQCQFSPSTILDFDTVIEPQQPSCALPPPGKVVYRETFVPRNATTKAAFILNVLTMKRPPVDRAVDNEGLIWYIASLQTALDGLNRAGGDDHDWLPPKSQTRRQTELATALHRGQLASVEDVILLARQLVRDQSVAPQLLLDWLAPLRCDALTAEALSADDYYPQASALQADEWLTASYPVWQLATDGVIVAANLAAYWMWGTLPPEQPQFAAGALLGRNVFTVLSQPDNMARLTLPANLSFFETKLAVTRKLAHFVEQAHAFVAFRKAVRAAAWSSDERQQIERWLDKLVGMVDNEWEYQVRLKNPPRSPTRNQGWLQSGALYAAHTQADEISPEQLEFATIVSVIVANDEPIGFIARYRPLGTDITKLERVSHKLRRYFHDIAYVQRLGGDICIRTRDEDAYHLRKAELYDSQTTLRSNLIAAIDALLDEQAAADVLSNFWDAYVYRSQFDWLEEAALDGAMRAFQVALRRYVAPKAEIAARQSDNEAHSVAELAPDVAADIKTAAYTALENPFTVADFTASFSPEVVSAHQLNPEQLSEHIRRALACYAEEKERGTYSPSPV